MTRAFRGSCRTQNGIALYAKIVSILRTQIASGHLAVGEQLPSIERLSEQYDVAAVTIRRAIRTLVEEGLLSSSRGRGTFVVSDQVQSTEGTKRFQTTSVKAMQVRLLNQVMGVCLPRELQSGSHRALPKYDWFRKLHHDRERKFFLMDFYVDPAMSPLLKSLPEQELMMIASLAEEFRRRRVYVESVVRVLAADAETAAILGCDLSFPVAEIRRFYLGRSGAILVASRAIYRAEVFELHTSQTISDFLSSRTESSVRRD